MKLKEALFVIFMIFICAFSRWSRDRGRGSVNIKADELAQFHLKQIQAQQTMLRTSDEMKSLASGWENYFNKTNTEVEIKKQEFISGYTYLRNLHTEAKKIADMQFSGMNGEIYG